MADDILTQEYLHSIFQYKDGNLYRKNSIGNKKIGDIVGSKTYDGYMRTKINKKSILIHRLIFFMAYGYFPLCIDHINGNKLDNRLENLREATFSQNQYNRKVNSNTFSKIKGIYWNKALKKWHAKCGVNGIRKHIGYFFNIDDAIQELQEYRMMHHGIFLNNGEKNENNS